MTRQLKLTDFNHTNLKVNHINLKVNNSGFRGICGECGIRHQNRRDNYCTSCRGGVLKYGKYKGKSFVWVYKNYKRYCFWTITKIGGGTFYEWLKKKDTMFSYDCNKILHVGKYSGWYYSKILIHDREYCNWILQLPNPCIYMIWFIKWLQSPHRLYN